MMSDIEVLISKGKGTCLTCYYATQLTSSLSKEVNHDGGHYRRCWKNTKDIAVRIDHTCPSYEMTTHSERLKEYETKGLI